MMHLIWVEDSPLDIRDALGDIARAHEEVFPGTVLHLGVSAILVPQLTPLDLQQAAELDSYGEPNLKVAWFNQVVTEQDGVHVTPEEVASRIEAADAEHPAHCIILDLNMSRVAISAGDVEWTKETGLTWYPGYPLTKQLALTLPNVPIIWLSRNAGVDERLCERLLWIDNRAGNKVIGFPTTRVIPKESGRQLWSAILSATGQELDSDATRALRDRLPWEVPAQDLELLRLILADTTDTCNIGHTFQDIGSPAEWERMQRDMAGVPLRVRTGSAAPCTFGMWSRASMKLNVSFPPWSDARSDRKASGYTLQEWLDSDLWGLRVSALEEVVRRAWQKIDPKTRQDRFPELSDRCTGKNRERLIAPIARSALVSALRNTLRNAASPTEDPTQQYPVRVLTSSYSLVDGSSVVLLAVANRVLDADAALEGIHRKCESGATGLRDVFWSITRASRLTDRCQHLEYRLAAWNGTEFTLNSADVVRYAVAPPRANGGRILEPYLSFSRCPGMFDDLRDWLGPQPQIVALYLLPLHGGLEGTADKDVALALKGEDDAAPISVACWVIDDTDPRPSCQAIEKALTAAFGSQASVVPYTFNLDRREELLRSILEAQPDVVLVDCNLQKENGGIDFVQALRCRYGYTGFTWLWSSHESEILESIVSKHAPRLFQGPGAGTMNNRRCNAGRLADSLKMDWQLLGNSFRVQDIQQRCTPSLAAVGLELAGRIQAYLWTSSVDASRTDLLHDIGAALGVDDEDPSFWNSWTAVFREAAKPTGATMEVRTLNAETTRTLAKLVISPDSIDATQLAHACSVILRIASIMGSLDDDLAPALRLRPWLSGAESSRMDGVRGALLNELGGVEIQRRAREDTWWRALRQEVSSIRQQFQRPTSGASEPPVPSDEVDSIIRFADDMEVFAGKEAVSSEESLRLKESFRRMIEALRAICEDRNGGSKRAS